MGPTTTPLVWAGARCPVPNCYRPVLRSGKRCSRCETWGAAPPNAWAVKADHAALDLGEPPRWENPIQWTYSVLDGRGDVRAVVVYVSQIFPMMPNGHHKRTQPGAAMAPNGCPFARRDVLPWRLRDRGIPPGGTIEGRLWWVDWLDLIHDGPAGRWVAVVGCSCNGADRWMATPERSAHLTLSDAQSWVTAALGLTGILPVKFFNVCDPEVDTAGYVALASGSAPPPPGV